jgi:hypothetical protein
MSTHLSVIQSWGKNSTRWLSRKSLREENGKKPAATRGDGHKEMRQLLRQKADIPRTTGRRLKGEKMDAEPRDAENHIERPEQEVVTTQVRSRSCREANDGHC